jgi:ABC-type transporter Mla MlaB component
MLRITMQDEMDHVKLKLEGNLSGSWVTELEECWRKTSRTLAGRELRLDLTAVGRIDAAGKYLLALLRGTGAVLIASGATNVAVVETIELDWPSRESSRRKSPVA